MIDRIGCSHTIVDSPPVARKGNSIPKRETFNVMIMCGGVKNRRNRFVGVKAIKRSGYRKWKVCCDTSGNGNRAIVHVVIIKSSDNSQVSDTRLSSVIIGLQYKRVYLRQRQVEINAALLCINMCAWRRIARFPEKFSNCVTGSQQCAKDNQCRCCFKYFINFRAVPVLVQSIRTML